jgi:hypothetical protein
VGRIAVCSGIPVALFDQFLVEIHLPDIIPGVPDYPGPRTGSPLAVKNMELGRERGR